MSKWLGEFRLIPILLIAAGCLLALKSMGLVFDGGYTLGQRLGGANTLVVTTVPVAPATQLRSPSSPLEVPTTGPKRSWMQEMFNYPDVTGSVAAKPPAKAPEGGKPERGKPEGGEQADNKQPVAAPPGTRAPGERVIAVDQSRPVSVAERALLERLQERRQELDARARELDIRESLVKSAEKKLESQDAAQKATEAKGGTTAQQKDNADAARLKGLVIMYETMKPKEAAKIFDRLDIKVLLEVVSQINPRQMSAILAQMSPEAAERLTVELAARSGVDKTVNPSELPKIEGKSGG
jgi:flagellar motility protein MotE (MotC chaperone)